MATAASFMDVVAGNPAFTTVGGSMALLFTLAFLIRRSQSRNWWEAPGLFGINANIKDTKAKAAAYTAVFAEGGGTVEDRKEKYQDMIDQYYDLSTDFYEFGWGQCFHFANRWETETFDESIKRHEYFLALNLGLKPGMKVLDAGCGVGGPARNIAAFSGASITGVTLNAYQVARGNRKAEAEGLGDLIKLMQGNFMDLPFEDESFDAVYAIEATCHAPDRLKCFSELYRVLKPGASFCGYEWVLTDKFDGGNPLHVELKEGIEVGDGLPELTFADNVLDSLRDAGFKVETSYDVAETSQVPWYQPFVPELSWSGLSAVKSSLPGIAVTSVLVNLLEFFGVAPKGTSKMHQHLSTAAHTLRKGGELGIFTPMLFFKATKPGDDDADSASSGAGGRRGSSASRNRRRVR